MVRLGTLAAVAARLPGMELLLRGAALLPVALKTAWVERLVCAIARRFSFSTRLLETKLGIDNGLRVWIPAQKVQLVFGRPDAYPLERATIALARHLAGRAGCFVDIGANEGLFALSVGMDRGDRGADFLHVFEPDGDLYERLTKNFRDNGICAKFHSMAVGAATGTALFYRNLSDDLSGSLAMMFAGSHELLPTPVEVVALTDYFDREGLSHACVKVDVEGAGMEVWQGAQRCAERIDWLLYEILEPEVRAELPRRIIEDGGFHAYYIRDYDLVESLNGEFAYVSPFYNWLFCRHAPGALQAVLIGTRFRVIAAKSASIAR